MSQDGDLDAARITLGVAALDLLRAAEVAGEAAATEGYLSALDRLQEAAFIAQGTKYTADSVEDGSALRQERERQLGAMAKSARREAVEAAVDAYEAAHRAALHANPKQGDPAHADAKYDAMRSGLTDMLGGGFLCYSCSIHRVHDAVERSRWLVTNGAKGEPGLDILVREWGPYPPYGSWPSDDDEEGADDE